MANLNAMGFTRGFRKATESAAGARGKVLGRNPGPPGGVFCKDTMRRFGV
jgi:hypothetical protein